MVVVFVNVVVVAVVLVLVFLVVVVLLLIYYYCNLCQPLVQKITNCDKVVDISSVIDTCAFTAETSNTLKTFVFSLNGCQ